MQLYIYHNKVLVGNLLSQEGGLSFCYDPSYLARPQSQPISYSLPLQSQPHSFGPTERFFDGLLPEGEERHRIARYLHVSSSSLHKLLSALAGDCVGNLTILSEQQDIDELWAKSGYRQLSKQEFSDILSADGNAIAKIVADNRLSIPGAQSKIGLYCQQESGKLEAAKWFAPEGLAASTHIIKPSSRVYENTSLNEFFCCHLAKACGIETAASNLYNYHGSPILVSTRFDRLHNTNGSITRLFQEDFCQALSAASNKKYEIDGGPSFRQILNIVRFDTTDPVAETKRLVQLFIFNYLIGNCDAHAKNYSLQRTLTGILRLAPAYDLVSTTFYPGLSANIAMGVNNVFAIDRITGDDFKHFCQTNSLAWEALVRIAGDLCQEISLSIPRIAATIGERGFDVAANKLATHLQLALETRSLVIR